MKTEARKVFTKEVLHNAAELFQIEKESLVELAGFENYIFGGNMLGQDVVIRFCHSSHRTAVEIDAELDWLFYLKNNHAAVCGPLLSVNKGLVEEVKAIDGSSFFISVFEKAQGKQMKLAENRLNTEFFYRWGKATGELHRLTKNYVPSHGVTPRQDYMEMSSKAFANYLPEDLEVKSKVYALFQQVIHLPKHEETYLLTHTDLHSGNFFYDGNRLWIFDFDDCSYHHIMHDLAMPIYYSLWLFEGVKEELQVFSERFFSNYLAGYLTENSIEVEELEKISLFLRLRDCDLYAILQEEWKGQEITEQRQKLLDSMRIRIVNEKPVVELPFKQLFKKAQELTFGKSE